MTLLGNLKSSYQSVQFWFMLTLSYADQGWFLAKSSPMTLRLRIWAPTELAVYLLTYS